MPLEYKISGTLNNSARILIIKESDWSVESNTQESIGSYEVTALASGIKLITARKSDGEITAYGNVSAISFYNSRGLIALGYDANPTYTNAIDYVNIASTGDAVDFGDTTDARNQSAGISNGSSDRGVFGGGYSPNEVNIMDYITMSSTGNASDFGDLTAGAGRTAATSDA